MRATEISSAYHNCAAVEPIDGSVDASTGGSDSVDASRFSRSMVDSSQPRQPPQPACLDAGLSTTLLTAESSTRDFLAHAVFIDDSVDAVDDPCESWKQVYGLWDSASNTYLITPHNVKEH